MGSRLSVPATIAVCMSLVYYENGPAPLLSTKSLTHKRILWPASRSLFPAEPHCRDMYFIENSEQLNAAYQEGPSTLSHGPIASLPAVKIKKCLAGCGWGTSPFRSLHSFLYWQVFTYAWTPSLPIPPSTTKLELEPAMIVVHASRQCNALIG